MNESHWPGLGYAAWRDTAATLQLWTQIVGKIRLSQTPWLNHSWHVPLYVSARGLSTSLIPFGSRSFEIEFDFNRHQLGIVVTGGERRQVELRPRTVADFHAEVLSALAELNIAVSISDYPCEIADAIRFSVDRDHVAYDATYANRFWRALVQIERVFQSFRTGFVGKCSPVHFFWGSFDLAVTRFSGRVAPPYQGTTPGVAADVMREAYSHEVSSAGFWPGGNGADDASFYSYAYPTPDQFRESPIQPAGAYFGEGLGMFLLPYDVVRTADDPQRTLLDFLQSSYEAAANSAQWDRAALECPLGVPGVPRPIVSRADRPI
jgi:Family of unknown function (DUF5996)